MTFFGSFGWSVCSPGEHRNKLKFPDLKPISEIFYVLHIHSIAWIDDLTITRISRMTRILLGYPYLCVDR